MTPNDKVSLIATVAAQIYPTITTNAVSDDTKAGMAVDIAIAIVRYSENHVSEIEARSASSRAQHIEALRQREPMGMATDKVLPDE